MDSTVDLVRAARAGDAGAFGALIARFQDMAYAAAYARLRDHGHAQDAAQDAFVEAYTGLGGLKDPAAFPGWFRRILIRQCARISRKRQAPTIPLEAAAGLRSSDPGPDAVVEARERRDAVRAAIETLPAHERSVTILFYIRDHSLREIAEFLGIPAATVKTRLHSARQRLKERCAAMLQENLVQQRPSRDGAFAERVLQIADALFLKTLTRHGPHAVSPDGDLIAFSAQDPTRVERFDVRERPGSFFLDCGAPYLVAGSDVRLVSRSTGETRTLTPPEGMDWSPRWSPDGRRLAFFGVRSGRVQLLVWDRETNARRAVSDRAIRCHGAWETPQWTPDGRSIVARLEPADAATRRPARRKPRTPPSGPIVWEFDPSAPAENPEGADWPAYTRNLLGDLALFDMETGEASVLASGARTYSQQLSPDGAAVAMLDFAGFPAPDIFMPLWDLVIVPLAEGELRRIVERIPQVSGISLSWSPDGTLLAYFDSEGLDLWVVPASGGAPINLTAEHPDRMAPRYDESRPVWVADGSALLRTHAGHVWRIPCDGHGPIRNLSERSDPHAIGIVTASDGTVAWEPDGAVVAVTHDSRGERGGLVRVPLDGRTPSPLGDVAAGIGSVRAFRDSRTGRDRLIYRQSDEAHPGDLWEADSSFADRRPLTRLNPALEAFLFGAPQRVEWTATDGRTLSGSLVLPASYEPGRRYPTIVAIDSHGERLSNHLLAGRGYAVFVLPVDLRTHEPLDELPGLVLPALDRLVERGVADPDRFGILGHSFGGYCVNGLITRTRRFRAAVSSAGISDLVSFYLSMDRDGKRADAIDWAERGQGNLGGSFWEHRDRYLENSPICGLSAVETPLLILHGDGDLTIPLEQATELYAGLRRLGKTVTLVRYPDEGHHPGESWRTANVEDRWRRILDWFERYL